jgi:hypothetical protein
MVYLTVLWLTGTAEGGNIGWLTNFIEHSPQLFKKSPPLFVELEGLLRCSQELATCLYLEPDESNS